MSGTKTSSFGMSKRENHDSKIFYSSKLYEDHDIKEIKDINENPINQKFLNKIITGDSRNLSFIPDESVHLVVTSPPYSVGKDYDENLSLDEYLSLIKDVMKEMFRILIRGGRVCLNIANIGRKPYIPLNSYVNLIMIELGFLMRGEIIWNKAASAGTSTAWGSFQSSTNATLRDVHEYIMVYSKGQFGRIKNNKQDSITKDDFLELTKSIWAFPTVSAKKIGHPAPFPLELPRRCIELYTLKDDIIIDPFNGAGTTCLAAAKSHRKYIGVDVNEEYNKLAKKRIRFETAQKSLNKFMTD